MKNLTFISASAGSGKTHRITGDIIDRLVQGKCRPGGFIATTFTKKAATELRDRLRQRLYAANQAALAEGLDQSLTGTVHSVCGQLLQRFAFEAGISPRLEILAPEEAEALLGRAVEMATDFQTIQELQAVADRLGQWDRQNSQYTWKKQVRQVIDAVRSNDFDPADLETMSERSVDSLLVLLPPPNSGDLDPQLLAAVQTALQKIGANGDDKKGTKDYLQWITGLSRKLADGRLPWSEWVALTKKDNQPCKPSQPDAAPVVEIALRVETHPRLREDIRQYTGWIFSLARQSLSTLQALKEERGLLDYTDLEQRCYHLLRDNPFVRETLRQELDLLVVDEFQDTSPIQLALFVQLAACAREAIWVGDVKQAIYGFRASDPDLIRAVVRGVEAGGGTLAEPLGTSWRSTRELVRLANALFIPAFQKSLGLPEAEVRLQPVPNRVSPPQPAVEFFDLSSGEYTKDKNNPKLKVLKNEDFAKTLAEGVAGLLHRDPGCQVVDKPTGKPRPIELRDIAILCRTNDRAAEAAAALTERGLPVTLAAPGLLATPEARLALACLRRLADPGDTLAAAEIVALEGTRSPEEWLQDRLAYLARRDAKEEAVGADRWGLEAPFIHPALAALEGARGHLRVFSPAEALDAALLAANVAGTISAWGPDPVRSAQRRANLEALRALLARCEESCATTHVPATIAGFLFWCEELENAKKDSKAADERANAIYVGTCHSAKGLEWPVVVCSNFDSEPKTRLWEVVTASDDPAKPFDLAAPLSNRCLRFWAWPFGQQETGIPLSDRVEASGIGQAALATARQEELRLLYVVLTRARDLLVLARDKAKPTPWLDCLEAPWLKEQDGNITLPDETEIPCRTVALKPPQEIAHPVPAPAYAWFPPPVIRSPRLRACLTPSGQAPLSRATIGRTMDFGVRLPLAGQSEEADLGDALHAILAAELLNPNHPGRQAMAERVLKGYGVEAMIRPEDVLALADRFRSQLETQFHPRRVWVETPFTAMNTEGQRVTGIIDLLLETEAGWVIVDHKSFPGKRSDWAAKALTYSGQLAMYRDAVRRLTGKEAETWIHFAVGGGLMEVPF